MPLGQARQQVQIFMMPPNPARNKDVPQPRASA
jgi:hypothetical protein